MTAISRKLNRTFGKGASQGRSRKGSNIGCTSDYGDKQMAIMAMNMRICRGPDGGR